MLARKNGRIIIGPGANVWPHELETAKVLAKNGHDIEFLRASSLARNYNADVYFDGEKWEIKSPRTNHTKTIYSNLKKARWQSKNVIIDSIRMKRVPDAAIEREIRKCIKDFDGEIERLIFINRKRIIKRIK